MHKYSDIIVGLLDRQLCLWYDVRTEGQPTSDERQVSTKAEEQPEELEAEFRPMSRPLSLSSRMEACERLLILLTEQVRSPDSPEVSLSVDSMLRERLERVMLAKREHRG